MDWLLLAGCMAVYVGALLYAGRRGYKDGKRDGEREGFDEGHKMARDEAAEHVKRAEKHAKAYMKLYRWQAAYSRKIECENALLRQMAGLTGEDV